MPDDLLEEEKQTRQGKGTSELLWLWNLLLLPLKILNLVISLSDLDFKGTDQNLHDLMVIFVVVGHYIIWKLLLDQGSSVDILYAYTLQRIQIPESSLSSYNGDLVDFSRERVNVLRVIELRTTFRTESNIKAIDV